MGFGEMRRLGIKQATNTGELSETTGTDEPQNRPSHDHMINSKCSKLLEINYKTYGLVTLNLL